MLVEDEFNINNIREKTKSAIKQKNEAVATKDIRLLTADELDVFVTGIEEDIEKAAIGGKFKIKYNFGETGFSLAHFRQVIQEFRHRHLHFMIIHNESNLGLEISWFESNEC